MPASINLSLNWNWGSLLLITLGVQLVTGIILSIHYLNSIEASFNRIERILIDIQGGWIYRSIHANGASLFFLLLYIHVGRGIYYKSYQFIETWNIGVVIIFALIGTAFVGYVLPWGQIRFWGATVIIRIFSAIPLIGGVAVQLIWGDYSVRGITLNRLFRIHFILPFLIAVFSCLHLIFLHITTSSNPLIRGLFISKIIFHPFYRIKDLLGILGVFILFIFFRLTYSCLLIDGENFLKANPLVTPVHIKPEWYFLFAYAILRSIPNKLGGVIFIILGIVVVLFPLFKKISTFKGNQYKRERKLFFWLFIFRFILLTWLGGQLAEEPYIIVAQLLIISYFIIGILYI